MAWCVHTWAPCRPMEDTSWRGVSTAGPLADLGDLSYTHHGVVCPELHHSQTSQTYGRHVMAWCVHTWAPSRPRRPMEDTSGCGVSTAGPLADLGDLWKTRQGVVWPQLHHSHTHGTHVRVWCVHSCTTRRPMERTSGRGVSTVAPLADLWNTRQGVVWPQLHHSQTYGRHVMAWCVHNWAPSRPRRSMERILRRSVSRVAPLADLWNTRQGVVCPQLGP